MACSRNEFDSSFPKGNAGAGLVPPGLAQPTPAGWPGTTIDRTRKRIKDGRHVVLDFYDLLIEEDMMLRRLLVGSAHYILGPFGPDTDLRRYGIRLSERGGKNAKKRAVVAVARKLAVLLHSLWANGEVYEPLRNALPESTEEEAERSAQGGATEEQAA